MMLRRSGMPELGTVVTDEYQLQKAPIQAILYRRWRILMLSQRLLSVLASAPCSEYGIAFLIPTTILNLMNKELAAML